MSDVEDFVKSKRNLVITDFFVDFLGALCPGVLFCVAIGLTVGLSSVFAINQIMHGISNCPTIENADNGNRLYFILSDLMDRYSFFCALFLLILSYVFGQFLYRRDLKEADTASYIRIMKKKKDKKINDWVECRPADFIEENNIKIEYPYFNLKKYFEKRGFEHLSNIITWSYDIDTDNEYNEYKKKIKDKKDIIWKIKKIIIGFDIFDLFKHGYDFDDKLKRQNGIIRRSKTFINILKVRINYYRPDCLSEIIKNEGHIRLMSSLWNMLKYMMKLSFMSIILDLSLLTITKDNIDLCVISIYISLFIFIFSKIGMVIIEGFFHYQRTREILYVLETAYFVSLEHDNMFKSLSNLNFENV